MNTSFKSVEALILRKFEKFRSDPGFCLAPELYPDPNVHENQDPDSNKVSSDPHHPYLFNVLGRLHGSKNKF